MISYYIIYACDMSCDYTGLGSNKFGIRPTSKQQAVQESVGSTCVPPLIMSCDQSCDLLLCHNYVGYTCSG